MTYQYENMQLWIDERCVVFILKYQTLSGLNVDWGDCRAAHVLVCVWVATVCGGTSSILLPPAAVPVLHRRPFGGADATSAGP